MPIPATAKAKVSRHQSIKLPRKGVKLQTEKQSFENFTKTLEKWV